METNNYLENYQILEDIAKSLESQEVADVDKILPQIDQASKAYAVCMDRINAVKEALKAKENN